MYSASLRVRVVLAITMQILIPDRFAIIRLVHASIGLAYA